MASILKVDTITGVTTAGSIAVTGEGNSTTTNLQQGLAKAWSSLDSGGGSTTTQHGSLNISSVLDDGVGQYGFNFSSNMDGATYSSIGTSNDNAGNNFVTNWGGVPDAYTSSRTGCGNLRVNIYNYVDSDVCIAVFGDLA